MKIRVHLMQRKDKRKRPIRNFEVQWIDPVTGMAVTETTGTMNRREAEEYRANKQIELQSSRGKMKDRATWDEFEAKLKEEYLDHRAPSHRRRVLVVVAMFVEAIRPKSAWVITDEEIAEFSAWLRRRKFKNGKRRCQETTITSHLRCLRLVFRFAKRRNYIREVPHFEMPKGVEKSKGRAITKEELERMIAKLPEIVGLYQRGRIDPTTTAGRRRVQAAKQRVDEWTFNLNGLWWSGLRINEAEKLDWEDDRRLCVDLTGKRPVFFIQAATDKGRKRRTFPMAPGFARQLETVAEKDRHGRVFRFRGPRGRILSQPQIEKTITALGEAARVRVADGKYASAQDFRRAFATRWAPRVKPATLQKMMRHKSISTTMKFYADLETQDVASEMWANDADAATNTSPNIDPLKVSEDAA